MTKEIDENMEREKIMEHIKKCPNVPVLIGIKYNNKYGKGLKFWCPFCRNWHHHGEGLGHRVAHCGKDTPFKETGYFLWDEKIPEEPDYFTDYYEGEQ